MESIFLLVHVIFSIIFERPIKFIGKHLQRFAYDRINISGIWKGSFEMGGVKGEEEIIIKQYGIRLEGYIITKFIKGQDSLESVFFGELVNDEFFISFYKPKLKDKFGSGAIVFKILDAGNKLDGCCAFQYTKDRSLKIIKNYVWEKKRKLAWTDWMKLWKRRNSYLN